MLRWLVALIALGVIAFWPAVGGAQPPRSNLDFVKPSGPISDCGEPCHLWLILDGNRAVTVELHMPSSGLTHRVRYAAGWNHEQSCPPARLELARLVAGTRYSQVFLTNLFKQGFCPRVSFDGIDNDARYLASRVWNDVVSDAQRARWLARDEYGRWVVPPIRELFASQEPSRWVTFSLFVSVVVQNADLLNREISDLLADPSPSSRQETADGGSSKMRNVLKVADAVTANGAVVEFLLNNLDSDPALAARPGYRRLIDNLAGISSSMPTWGSPPVCANVDRIATYLPWGRDASRDAQYLSTLSRCDRGSEGLLRRALSDNRREIAATGLRVWWAAVAGGRTAAASVAPDVVALVVKGDVPTAAASPVHRSTGRAQLMIKDGAVIEEVALGLSSLGLLSSTVEQLNAAGRPEQARALFLGLQQGLQRLVR